PVPAANLHPVGDRVLGLDAFPTPGHASHHVSYFDAEGTLYAGDAVGVRIQPGRHILPVAPPPDVDLEAWELTLQEIDRRAPDPRGSPGPATPRASPPALRSPRAPRRCRRRRSARRGRRPAGSSAIPTAPTAPAGSPGRAECRLQLPERRRAAGPAAPGRSCR